MKGLLIGLAAVVVLSWAPLRAKAGFIFDHFNDGNSDGWVFPYNSGMSQAPGQWSVENGTLAQRYFGDNNSGLVDNVVISDQVIEAQVRTTRGYAGFALWYQQVDDARANYVAISNWSTGNARVVEFADGQAYTYYYPAPGFDDTNSRFYDWRVEAESATGAMTVYLDDIYVFTHTVTTPYRTGLSGVYSGNEHGYFDDFRLTSDDLAPVPEPTSLVFWSGLGVMGLIAARRRRRKRWIRVHTETYGPICTRCR